MGKKMPALCLAVLVLGGALASRIIYCSRIHTSITYDRNNITQNGIARKSVNANIEASSCRAFDLLVLRVVNHGPEEMISQQISSDNWYERPPWCATGLAYKEMTHLEGRTISNDGRIDVAEEINVVTNHEVRQFLYSIQSGPGMPQEDFFVVIRPK